VLLAVTAAQRKGFGSRRRQSFRRRHSSENIRSHGIMGIDNSKPAAPSLAAGLARCTQRRKSPKYASRTFHNVIRRIAALCLLALSVPPRRFFPQAGRPSRWTPKLTRSGSYHHDLAVLYLKNGEIEKGLAGRADTQPKSPPNSKKLSP